MADFFFKTSRFGFYLFMIPKSYRYLLTFGMLASISLIWLFFTYYPLQKRYNSYLKKIDQIYRDQALEKKILTNSNKLQLKLDRKLKKYNQEVTFLQKNCKSINDAIMAFLDQAHSINLTVQSHTPYESYSSEDYIVHPFKTEFHGEFINCLNFLKNFSSSSLPIKISSLNLEPLEEDLLKLVFHFDIYQMQEELP